MDRFKYEKYDGTLDEVVFSETNGYSEPSGEEETRKQFSAPLKEIKDYLNNTATVDTTGNQTVYQLGLTSDRIIRYRSGPNETWKDTQSAGHKIVVSNEGVVRTLPQRAILRFENVEARDTGGETVIQALKGDKGETGLTGPQGPQGVQGPVGWTDLGQHFIGSFANFNVLVQQYPRPQNGAFATTLDDGQGYMGSTYYCPVTSSYWHPIGQPGVGPSGAIGPQGPMGPAGADGKAFQLLGLYETYSDFIAAHPTGEAGEAYAVGTEDSNVIYIWDIGRESWISIGTMRGPEGPSGTGVPDAGQTGQTLIKNSDDDGDYSWADIPVDQIYDSTSSIPQSGVAVASAINGLRQLLFPVGSVKITSTNVAPTFGTWELIDKHFADTVITDYTDLFTPNATNVNTVDLFRLERREKSIRVCLNLASKVKLTTSEKLLGSFGDLGADFSYATNIVARTDKGLFTSLQANTSKELVFRRANTDLSAGTQLLIDFNVLFTKEDMDDSLCDKFFWKRVA